MNIDKHFDPTDDLEKELLQELDGIARQLNGKITYSTYGNSMGRSSKTVTIEYDITESVSYTHLTLPTNREV